MEKIRILITVKTAPLPSNRYIETVCTAGIKADGVWIRIYPVPFRLLEKSQQFSKYQWIEVRVQKDTSDPRPESHKMSGQIKPLKKVDTHNVWHKRKKLVLRNVHTNLTKLIAEARDKSLSTSLAVFKPMRITGFHVRAAKQGADHNSCKRSDRSFTRSPAEQVPYTFHYSFVDETGRRSCLQILDWEVYQLCRKLMRKYGNDLANIERHLARKYFDEFCQKREVYFFLGTTKCWHIRRSRNPFCIIGVFYPPK